MFLFNLLTLSYKSYFILQYFSGSSEKEILKDAFFVALTLLSPLSPLNHCQIVVIILLYTAQTAIKQ